MDNACIHFRAALMHAVQIICTCDVQLCKSLQSHVSCTAEMKNMWEDSRRKPWNGLNCWQKLIRRFAQGYYYLGYAYLNLGLYAKADITWREFHDVSASNNKDKKEIRKRLDQITEPRQIEAGCNEITAGKYEDGISLLEPFLSSRFNDWWPLHYYLGVAYEMTGRRSEAVSAFRKVLQLNGSHLETMKELMSIL